MTRITTIITILFAMTTTSAMAFPTGEFTNKSGDITITQSSGKYNIEAIASDESGHSCEISGTLSENSAGALSGKIDGKPVTVRTKGDQIILKAKDAEVCGIGTVMSGSYRKKK